MFTTQHYKVLASIIRRTAECVPQDDTAIADGMRAALGVITSLTVQEMKADNPRFDTDAFIRAIGWY